MALLHGPLKTPSPLQTFPSGHLRKNSLRSYKLMICKVIEWQVEWGLHLVRCQSLNGRRTQLNWPYFVALQRLEDQGNGK